MKKKNIVKSNRDYNRIIKNEKPYKTNDFIIYLERNHDSIYHFGFSIGKKIGNAVTRNRLKRQIKSILDENHYQNGFNCIIIVRKAILEENFFTMRKNLNNIMDTLKLIKEKDDENNQ